MKTVTMRDIAKAAGVSLTTVSRVISGTGYVAEDKRKAVMAAADELGYEFARSPHAFPDKKLIGVFSKELSPSPLNSFSLLRDLLSHAAYQKGFDTISFLLEHVDNQSLLASISQAKNYHLSGLIILGFVEEHPSPELAELFRCLDIPIVFVERAKGCYDYNRILVDNVRGLYLATRHLLARGHKKLLYVSRQVIGGGVEEERLRGYKMAIEDEPGQAAEGLVFYIPRSADGRYISEGYQAAEWMLTKHPDITAILNWSDGLAAGELQYLTKKGIRVPDDVEIIGYDDTIAQLLAPPLSSVQMPYAEMAEAAIQCIQEQRISTDYFARSVTLSPRLNIR